MTSDEKLDLILSRLDNVDKRLDTMQNSIDVLNRVAVLVETDIAPKVQILLENHSDLAKNILVAKDIEERVGSLEFDMKVVKNILKSKAI